MKKVFALLLACVLLVVGSMTAFAAPSSEAPSGGSSILVDAEGIDEGMIVISYDYKNAEDAAAAAAIQKDLAAALAQAGISDTNLKLHSVFDASIVGNYEIEDYILLTFAVAGLTPDTKAYVLHYENGKWNNVTHAVGTNQITGKFHTLSPVAIVVEKDAATGSGTGTNGAGSPSTGDNSMAAPMGIAVAVVAAVAGASVSARRRRA